MKLTDLLKYQLKWRKEKTTRAVLVVPVSSTVDSEPVEPAPLEPTLEEKLEMAVREKQYAAARDIYLQLGQTDQAVQMYIKENEGRLRQEMLNGRWTSPDIFSSAVEIFSKQGITLREALPKVFSYCNQIGYSLVPLAAYLKRFIPPDSGYDYVPKRAVEPETALLLSEMASVVYEQSKNLSPEWWGEILGDFFEMCNDHEKAREAYLQGAAVLVNKPGDDYQVKKSIILREKAGLLRSEAISLTLHERLGKVYLISKIVRDYADAITLEDREAIIKNMPDFESAGVYQAEIAGIYERLGFLREAAGLYAQANGKESQAKALQIYSQLDDDTSVVGLIATGEVNGIKWAVNQTIYNQKKKDLLTTQLQLLQHLSGEKLPAKEETLLFMGY